MGLLIDGQWHTDWYDTESTGGKFKRKQSHFRHWVTADGTAGPTGDSGFKAEIGRYHLYVSLACPWAHRALIFRALKGLQDMVSVSVVNAYMGDDGWTFLPDAGVVADSVNHVTFVRDLYTLAQADYTGRVTVPILWDKQQNTIVSNESSEIIRMFNSAFDHLGAKAGDYYPKALQVDIDDMNNLVYSNINNGVYKAGFATTQAAYEKAFDALFAALDKIDAHLTDKRYLVGQQITEADWRLFTTLIRFDAVYVGHFKCNYRRIKDYKALSGYLRDLYQQPKVEETVNMDHIKAHYYGSHPSINPTGVIPAGPILDFNEPHDRTSIGKL